MLKKIVLIALIPALLLSSCGGSKDQSKPVPSKSAVKIDPNTPYTLAEIEKHNKPTDCWTTINGGVYNLTNWINSHPGGSMPIINLCGSNGSAMFNIQHGAMQNPKDMLANFKVGTLKSEDS